MPLRQDVIQKLKTAADNGSWWDDPTALVTNGPYSAVSFDGTLRLEQNSYYYGDQSGPHAIEFHFAASDEEAQAL